MTIIDLINKDDKFAIQKCATFCSNHFLENLVLLGDLYEPCVKYSDIYAIYDDKGNINAAFTIFHGFLYPSVVISYNLSDVLITKIFNFVKNALNSYFSLVCFEFSLKLLKESFEAVEVSEELCMILSSQEFTTSHKNLSEDKVVPVFDHDIEEVKTFYDLVEAYPWNPIQLESGFYKVIWKNNSIIASGGTHFETPRLAHLGNIYVLPEFRTRGYGKLLVSSIVSAVLKNKEICSLFVRKDNTAAISLYKSLGFQFYKPVSLYLCR